MYSVKTISTAMLIICVYQKSLKNWTVIYNNVILQRIFRNFIFYQKKKKKSVAERINFYIFRMILNVSKYAIKNTLIKKI